MERLKFLTAILITIPLGLASRKFFEHDSWVFLFAGDILWATMFYFIFRFIFVKKSIKFAFFLTVLWSYLIEFSQLYQAEWLVSLRKTTFGILILGNGFLFSDLISYLIGVFLGYFLELFLFPFFTSKK